MGIDAEGRILVHNEVTPEIVEILRQQIESTSIPQEFVTDAFAEYVNRKYSIAVPNGTIDIYILGYDKNKNELIKTI